jgi:hypothetical protein
MKACEWSVRGIALLVLCCFASAGAQSQAPTVTVSPGNLSFGVPIGTSVSAPEAVKISVAGSGSATVSSIAISATMANGAPLGSTDFTETDTCAKPVAAPGSCEIDVTFKPSTAAGVLESATLSFVTGIEGSVQVPLTGALGAIRVLDPVNVAMSNPNSGLENLVTFGSTTLTLSCATPPTAKLSSTPDGTGNVFVDNFLTLQIGPSPIVQTKTSTLMGDVCPANSGNPSDGGQADCFTHAYQDNVSSVIGQDPDGFTGPGSSTLPGSAAGGVSPIDVSSQIGQLGGTPGNATFGLLDGGGEVGSSTLFLVTSCSAVNAQSGTETGNPVNTQNNSNLAQTLTFDSVLNHLDQYTFDYSFAAGPPTTITTNSDSTPIVNNQSISQAAFSALVAGGPFAGTACIGLASLNGNCAGKRQLCTTPSSSTPSGPNCPQSSQPNTFYSTTFDPNTLIIYPNTVFGFLEFNDEGTCVGGFEGPESVKSCPQNQLVSFNGPGEYKSGKGTKSANSTSVVVTGVVPPTTAVVVTPFVSTGPSAGWTNSNPTITFTGQPPAQPAGTPVAPVDFIEYGINQTAQGLPPTFPIPFPGNSAFTTPDQQFTNPGGPCPSTIPLSAPSVTATPPFTPGPFAVGSSNLLHYSTTDCSGTHELQFTFANNVWSTNFKSLTLNTDALPPTISITTPSNGATYTANKKVPAAYGCSDPESGPANCTGTVANGSNIDTTPTAGLLTTKTFTVNSVDNVGNAAAPDSVTYLISCHYASVGISPSTVKRPGFVTISTSVTDCMSAPQKVAVKFTLSGPLGRHCGNSSTVIFRTPSFTIKSGTSSSTAFPFPIFSNACPGTYTLTTTTLQGSTTIDTVTSMLTVTTH